MSVLLFGSCVGETSAADDLLVNSSAIQAGSIVGSAVTLRCDGGRASSTNLLPDTTQRTAAQTESHTSMWLKLFDFVASVIGSLVWPLAVIFIAWHFKRELASLIARIKVVKAGGTEFSFEGGVDDAVDAATTAHLPPEEVSPLTVKNAVENPRATVVAAWIGVEDALRRVYRRLGLDSLVTPVASTTAYSPRRSVLSAGQVLRALQKAQRIDSSQFALAYELMSLRNQAAHDPDFSSAPDAIVKYVQLSKELAAALDQIVLERDEGIA